MMKAWRKIILVSCAVLFAVLQIASAQNKLVLIKGIRKAVLHKGLRVIPLVKSDSAGSNAQVLNCDQTKFAVRDSVWEIDSIGDDSRLFLKRFTGYKYDTLTTADLSRMTNRERRTLEREWILDTVLYTETSCLYAFKKEEFNCRTVIKPDTLAGFRFPQLCIYTSNDKTVYRATGILSAVNILFHSFGLVAHKVNVGSAVSQMAISGFLFTNSMDKLRKFKVKTYWLKDWRMDLHRRKWRRVY